MSNTEHLLEVKNLFVSVKEEGKEEMKEILKGVNLVMNKGEVHVLMGTNGSGKSTLANALMGHPNYKITRGRIFFLGEDITDLSPDEKARRGLFLAFQYPTSISGLPVGSFLRAIMKSVNEGDMPIKQFRRELNRAMEELKVPRGFLKRSLNEGFSGGEKKRHEILQMNLLNPKLSILDETDSGLDVDALKLVFENVNNKITGQNGALIITHYSRVLNYLNPHKVHIVKDGRITKSGGVELSDRIEDEGFEAVLKDE
jgi:Fe-S cluster assembly ATP-binding protein